VALLIVFVGTGTGLFVRLLQNFVEGRRRIARADARQVVALGTGQRIERATLLVGLSGRVGVLISSL
jgi:hypothetical protein